MTVHVIIDIKVLNESMYEEYIRKVPPIVKKYGGRYLIRGGKITSISGNWHPERLIILEFDTVTQIHQWLNSPEYKEVASLRENATQSNAIIIEGGGLP